MRKAVAAHSKQGWVYILDRVTGKPLIPVEMRPVPQEPRQLTADTQPIPAGDPTAPQCAEPVQGHERGCMFTPQWSDTMIAQPSASGDWAPGAYDPRTGFLYFTVGVSTRRFTLNGRTDVPGTREYGLITALDSRTNRQVWQEEVPYFAGFGSGVLATGGGLLFHGGTDGFFRAFDSRSGEELWRFQTGFGADAPAAAYEIDGEQDRGHRGRRWTGCDPGGSWGSRLGVQGRRPPEPAERTGRTAVNRASRQGRRPWRRHA